MMKFPSSLRWCSAALLIASLAGCDKNAAPLPPQAPPSPHPSPAAAKIVSAEPTSFDAIAKHLDAGGGLYFYLSTEGFMKSASEGLSAIVEPLIGAMKLDPNTWIKVEAGWKSLSHFTAQSGLNEISGFGASSIALEPDYYQNKWMLHHDAAKSKGLLWKLHSSTPNALDFISYLPEQTALATSGNTNLAPIWEALNQEAATNEDLRQGLDLLKQQFQQYTGLDLPALLASLGPNYSLIVTLDEKRMTTIPAGPNGQSIAIPEPALALLVQVQDDVLINRVNEALSALPMITKNDEGGLKVRSLSMPLPLPFLRPAVAWQKGLLMITSSEPLLREMLEVKAGKKPGIAAQASFKKLQAGMPTTGCEFGYVSPSLQKAIQDFQLNSFKNDNKVLADPAVQKVLEKLYTINRQGPAYSVVENTPEGWVGTSHSGTGPTQIVAAAAVFPVAILAGAAVPAVIQAKAKAEAIRKFQQGGATPAASPAGQ